MPSTPPRAPFIANFVHDPNYKSHFPDPIFEITGIQGVEQDGGLVYRLNLSDGRHWVWGILLPNLHDMVNKEEIKVHTFVKLITYYLESYKGKRFVAVEEIEVLSPQLSYAGSNPAKQHLETSKPDGETEASGAVNLSNGAHISAPALRHEHTKGRVMLGDIGGVLDRMAADFLVVVLGKRKDRMKGKQDYYLWDSSSPIIEGKLRKTIISVWGRLRDDFKPNPGTIVALKGITKFGKFEEHPTEPRMIAISNMGHLNVWTNTIPRGSPWFLIDPTQAEGYEELKDAWEEQQYDLGGDAIIQEMSLIGDL